MNRTALILGVALTALVMRAQTNSDAVSTNTILSLDEQQTVVETAAATNTPPAPTGEVRITSQSGEASLDTRIAIHRGNVVATITDPIMRLTCDVLTIRVPKEGEKPDHILAEGHVVIDHKDENGNETQGTGERALYVFEVSGSTTNETITFGI